MNVIMTLAFKKVLASISISIARTCQDMRIWIPASMNMNMNKHSRSTER